MGELVNLRLARKKKARGEKEAAAAENRARFGRSKAEREREAAGEALDRRRLDAHKLELDSSGEPDAS